MHTITIEMPDSQHDPDVSWRIAEYVRVLNAAAVIEAAVRPSTRLYGDFAFVPKYVYSVDKPGKKFTRIVYETENQRFVHCFVENATGKVIKAAGWTAPAKDKAGLAYRYDLMDRVSRVGLYAAGTRASFYKS